MLLLSDIPERFDAGAASGPLLGLLPGWRRDRALSYRNDIDRYLCAKSYLMLLEGLEGEYGIHGSPEFAYGPCGKPYLPAFPGIHFNLSHCRRGIACAISDRPVGVDIEEIQFDSDFAATVLNDSEMASVKASDRPAEAFTALWTRKESCLKLLGTGLADGLRNVLSDHLEVGFTTEIRPAVGYVVTTACRNQ